MKILVKITFHPILTRSKYGLKTPEKLEFIYSLLSPHSHFFDQSTVLLYFTIGFEIWGML